MHTRDVPVVKSSDAILRRVLKTIPTFLSDSGSFGLTCLHAHVFGKSGDERDCPGALRRKTPWSKKAQHYATLGTRANEGDRPGTGGTRPGTSASATSTREVRGLKARCALYLSGRRFGSGEHPLEASLVCPGPQDEGESSVPGEGWMISDLR